MKTNEQAVIHLSDSDPALFERFLLLAMDQFGEVFNKYKDTLCVRETDGKWTADFEVPVHNALYMCIRDYRRMLGGNDSGRPIDGTLLRAFLMQQATMGSEYVGVDEVDEAVAYMTEIRELNSAYAVVTVMDQIQRWLRKRRMNDAMRRIMRVDGWDPEVMKASLDAAVNAVQLSAMKTSFKFGDCLNENLTVAKRYPITGMNEMNAVFGGGFCHGEYSLFIASTGAGKTVMALQGLRVLFVTTEQGPAELEPRIISSFCNIPFSQVRDGVDMKSLAGFQRDAIARLRKNLDGRLWIEDWSKTRGASLSEDIDGLVDRYEKQYGKMDVLVFDWLGGALGELSKEDMHVYRLILHNTGETLGKLADSRNMIVVSFAQANFVQAKNRKKVDISMIAECKSVGNKAENIYGMSCLLLPDAEDDDVRDAYKEEQYLYASKSRKSRGIGCRMWRDFDYQRFTDRRPTRGMPTVAQN